MAYPECFEKKLDLNFTLGFNLNQKYTVLAYYHLLFVKYGVATLYKYDYKPSEKDLSEEKTNSASDVYDKITDKVNMLINRSKSADKTLNDVYSQLELLNLLIIEEIQKENENIRFKLETLSDTYLRYSKLNGFHYDPENITSIESMLEKVDLTFTYVHEELKLFVSSVKRAKIIFFDKYSKFFIDLSNDIFGSDTFEYPENKYYISINERYEMILNHIRKIKELEFHLLNKRLPNRNYKFLQSMYNFTIDIFNRTLFIDDASMFNFFYEQIDMLIEKNPSGIVFANMLLPTAKNKFSSMDWFYCCIQDKYGDKVDFVRTGISDEEMIQRTNNKQIVILDDGSYSGDNMDSSLFNFRLYYKSLFNEECLDSKSVNCDIGRKIKIIVYGASEKAIEKIKNWKFSDLTYKLKFPMSDNKYFGNDSDFIGKIKSLVIFEHKIADFLSVYDVFYKIGHLSLDSSFYSDKYWNELSDLNIKFGYLINSVIVDSGKKGSRIWCEKDYLKLLR